VKSTNQKEHPLDYILRKRKIDDFDFDMVCAYNYFCGQFDNKAPVDKNREVWAHFKKLLLNKSRN
jgi:hypothetical protein